MTQFLRKRYWSCWGAAGFGVATLNLWRRNQQEQWQFYARIPDTSGDANPFQKGCVEFIPYLLLGPVMLPKVLLMTKYDYAGFPYWQRNNGVQQGLYIWKRKHALVDAPQHEWGKEDLLYNTV